MKVLVCGSRSWTASDYIFDELDEFKTSFGNDLMIIHGEARGADSIAGQFCKNNGIMEVKVPANWGHFGKSAGPIRNGFMLRLEPDVVLAFMLPDSKGTQNMVNQSVKAGIKTYVFLDNDGVITHQEL